MARSDTQVEHMLRRAGFGASADEIEAYRDMRISEIVSFLIDYEKQPDDVDTYIGQSGYAQVTTRGQFSPNTVINDARQRWLFRMVHTQRPLQEKMALFWHNHFATAYSKVAGAFGGVEGTRMMAAKPSEDPGQVKGQIELFREFALGNFRDLLIAVAKDPAMLVWLDGRTNTRARPQENFAREIMELFTIGVDNYTEADVYAGARVFTGWNLQRVGERDSPAAKYEFFYNAGQHETTAKEFSFPIYPDGNRRIPARSAIDGLQDGVDFINALARHPETGRRLMNKLYRFFVNEVDEPDGEFIDELAAIYDQNTFAIKPVVRRILLSAQFAESGFKRYSWPVEYVIRAIKEVGWTGFSVDTARDPLTNMGQQLFEPPDVNGWELGPGWFSSGATLARMNFAATLTTNQRINLRELTRPRGRSPEQLLSFFLNDRLTVAPLDQPVYNELLNYLRSSGTWTGSDAQLTAKAPGLAHLIVGSSEYQFV